MNETRIKARIGAWNHHCPRYSSELALYSQERYRFHTWTNINCYHEELAARRGLYYALRIGDSVKVAASRQHLVDIQECIRLTTAIRRFFRDR